MTMFIKKRKKITEGDFLYACRLFQKSLAAIATISDTLPTMIT